MASGSSFGGARSKFKNRLDLGRIHYKVSYDDATSMLHVTVVECSKLKNPEELLCLSNPLVRLYLLPGEHEVIKTEVN